MDMRIYCVIDVDVYLKILSEIWRESIFRTEKGIKRQMASLKIVKWIDLKGINDDLLAAAGMGVEAAVQETVSWIKNDVLLGQEFMPSKHFPDVAPATKKRKMKKGNMKVLIDTGNYKDSFIGEANGLVGRIHSGSKSYFAQLHKKWRIDKLWMKVHSKESQKIIEMSVAMAIKKMR